MICERLPAIRADKVDLKGHDFVFIFGHRVAVDRTPCTFGGHRHWFLCPLCERRCAVLYRSGCRLCVGAHYRSESLSPKNRRLRKAIKRRSLLGQGEGGLLRPFPTKPKWMRWKTYLELRKHALREEAEIVREMYGALCQAAL